MTIAKEKECFAWRFVSCLKARSSCPLTFAMTYLEFAIGQILLRKIKGMNSVRTYMLLASVIVETGEATALSQTKLDRLGQFGRCLWRTIWRRMN